VGILSVPFIYEEDTDYGHARQDHSGGDKQDNVDSGAEEFAFGVFSSAMDQQRQHSHYYKEEEEITDEDGSDTYSAIHKYVIEL
jgi:hypothetical protein